MKRQTGKILIAFVIILALVLAVAFTGPLMAKKGGRAKAVKDKAGKEYKLVYAADIIAVKGQGFKVKRVSSPHEVYGRPNMANYVKDVLRTDKDTVACIEFLNGSQLGINKDSVVEIISTTSAKDVTRRGIIKKVMLKSGTVWAKITKGHKGGFSVETDNGVLGVKGTEFVVESDAATKKEKVTILDGKVEFIGKSGMTKLLTPGDVFSMLRGQAPQLMKVPVKQLQEKLKKEMPALNPQLQAMMSARFGEAMSKFNDAEFQKAMQQSEAMMAEAQEKMAEAQKEMEKEMGNMPEGMNMPPMGNFGPSGPTGPSGNSGSKPAQKKTSSIKLHSPTGTVSTYNPVFKWDKYPGAAKYQVMINRMPFDDNEKDPGYYALEEVTANQMKYPENKRQLKPGMTYYWRVVPLDANGKVLDGPSKSASFKMANLQSLGLKGLYPSGDVAPAKSLIFDWTPISGITAYKLVISKSSNMSSPVLSTETSENYYEFADAASKLSKGTRYYWKAVPVKGNSGTPNIKGVVNEFRMTDLN